MKNLLNYLDDYFDENVEETLCNRKFKGKINTKRQILEYDQITEKNHHKKEKHKNK